jgi:hypothetical protein
MAYFDVNENGALERDEVLGQFSRWLEIAKFAESNQMLMDTLRIKRTAYSCSACSAEESKSDLCYGPIRQFEQRARERYATMMLRKGGDAAGEKKREKNADDLLRFVEETKGDAETSTMTMNCKNLMEEFSKMLLVGQVPGKTAFEGGRHPALVKSSTLANYLDRDQENEDGRQQEDGEGGEGGQGGTEKGYRRERN